MIKPVNYGTFQVDNRLVYFKIKMLVSTQSNFILMEPVWLQVVKTRQLKFGILEVKDWSKNMMHTLLNAMKLISIQMEDTFFQVVMTQL